MQFLYEIFPVLLFFLAFKFYDIYVATIVGILSTLLLVIFNRCYVGKWDKKQLITLAVFVFFGGLTLYFHNPIFVKWKPTIIFWVFSIVLLGSQLFTSRPLIQRMMTNMLQDKGEIPTKVWQILNIVWAVFFVILGAVNLYIAYHYSSDAWVNFKFYGITAALLGLSIVQAIYLTRYMTEKK